MKKNMIHCTNCSAKIYSVNGVIQQSLFEKLIRALGWRKIDGNWMCDWCR